MAIDSKRILNMSTGDYLSLMGRKSPRSYEVVGVEDSYQASMSSRNLTKALENFAKAVPDNAEVVTDRRIAIAGAGPEKMAIFITGNALIPRE